MRLLAIAFLTLFAQPGHAAAPSTAATAEALSWGFMSGLAHPVPGIEHLMVVLIMGAAAALSRHTLQGIAAYLTAMSLACVAIFFAGELPVQQGLGAISFVLFGALVASARHLSPLRLAIVFATAGLLHGAVFSSAILGDHTGGALLVLAGYLTGFAGTQALIAAAAALLATGVRPLSVRLAGAVAVSAGVVLCFEMAEAALAG